MHRCLGILEIVHLVCTSLDPMADEHWMSPSDRGAVALSALARTCTLFNGPALDMLWRQQSGFTPLLRLFPADLFPPLLGSTYYTRVWSMLRPLFASDWTRVLLYIPRVKVLSLNYPYSGVTEILLALSECCPGGFLFPNLRTFAWPFRDPIVFPIRILCPPGLKEIKIHCETTNHNISRLSTLSTSCPDLRYVSVSFQSRSEQTDAAVSLLVCGLRRLESLTIGVPTMAAMQHIATSPGLTSLELAEIPPMFSNSGRSDPPMFPQLTRLTIGPIAADLVTTFLRSFSHAPFISMRIDLAACVTTAGTEALFRALHVACAHESLESFRLGTHANEVPSVLADYTISGGALKILACFSNIENLSIASPAGFDFDDATFAQLAAAWTGLVDLSLTHGLPDSFRRPLAKLTLRSLHSLAQYCPQLSILALEFAAESIPPHSEDAQAQHELVQLDVASSPIAASAPVARYLSRIFPCLSEILTIREEEDNDDPEELEEHPRAIRFHRLWKQVEEQIPEFVGARREEYVSAIKSFTVV
ncbi:hypothetical protein DFH06DRAFT_62318 [Mycena polygramma]|nr:hypothetical protein DFH06DRAFT_171543 [Mycena polygramma]KAJ7620834.1 hypothetical protein DFH06DRAFT_62318 [Mycena polygramma]